MFLFCLALPLKKATSKIYIKLWVNIYLIIKNLGMIMLKLKISYKCIRALKFNKDYREPISYINKYREDFLFGGSQNELTTTLKNERAPSTFNKCVSI